jgi:hypothetical protein
MTGSRYGRLASWQVFGMASKGAGGKAGWRLDGMELAGRWIGMKEGKQATGEHAERLA